MWKATAKLGGVFGAATRFLLLTGVRRDEGSALRWDELDGGFADEQLVSIEAFVFLANLSKETLKRKKRAGELPPALKISARCVRWRLSDVRRWIAEKQQATSAK